MWYYIMNHEINNTSPASGIDFMETCKINQSFDYNNLFYITCNK